MPFAKTTLTVTGCRTENERDQQHAPALVFVPACVSSVSVNRAIINNPWSEVYPNRSYQQTFQVYGRPRVFDHVLQLLPPVFHPPLGAERHGCSRDSFGNVNKKNKKKTRDIDR